MFLARDPDRSRSVAVKVFRLDITPEQAGELAAQLARLAHANLMHPSIVAPLDAGIEGSVAYLASDFISAESLDAAVRQYGPAPLAQAMRILTSIAGALDFAAAAGIQHGALHPRDVLVAPDDTHVTGLGVGRALETIGLRAPMRRPYVAPERVQRESWDARADVYSLAMLARERLVGRSRLERETDVDPRLLEEQADRVVPVLSKATAARPDDRFPSSLDFVGALQDALDGTRRHAASPVPAVGAEPRRARDAKPRHATHDLLLPLDEDALPDAVEVPEAQGQALPETPSFEPALSEPADALGQLRIDADRADTEHPADAIELSEGEGPEPDVAVIPPEGQPHEPVFVPEAPPDEPSHGRDESPFLLEEEAETPPVAPRPTPGPVRASSRLSILDTETDGAVPQADATRARGRSWGIPLLIVGLVLGTLGGYLVGTRHAMRTATTSPAQQEAAPNAPLAQVAPGPASTAAAAPRGPADDASKGAVSGPGRAPATRTSPGPVGPAPGAVKPAPASSTPAAPRPTNKVNGVLVVQSSPSGASVTVNGRRRGSTPLRLRNLSSGKYTVSVSRRGYATEQRDVVLSSDRPASTMNFSLKPSGRTEQAGRAEPANRAEPSTAAEFFGSLSVESLPSGAQVFVDGKLIGTTPLASARIPVGSHVIRVSRTGFQPWTTAVQVVSGQRVRVTASLERESA